MKTMFLFSLLLPLLALAQPDETARAKQIAAIDRISWLAGEWEGTATFDRGPQGKSDVASWERVTRAAGGTALMVLGRHYVRNADGTRGNLVHDAAALLTFDERANKYRFQSQLGTGLHGTFTAEMQGAAFVWHIETPRGLIRYHITRDGSGRWNERGEMCPISDKPDTPCRDFFSMQLTKTKSVD